MIVYTGGTFDLFHAGHVSFLRRAAELGQVTVSLNTDAFVARFKGRPPVINYENRETVVRSCRYVSHVVPNIGDEDSRPAILAVHPDIIVIGDDWAPPRDYLAQMSIPKGWLEERSISLLFLTRTPNISSSEIREALDITM